MRNKKNLVWVERGISLASFLYSSKISGGAECGTRFTRYFSIRSESWLTSACEKIDYFSVFFLRIFIIITFTHRAMPLCSPWFMLYRFCFSSRDTNFFPTQNCMSNDVFMHTIIFVSISIDSIIHINIDIRTYIYTPGLGACMYIFFSSVYIFFYEQSLTNFAFFYRICAAIIDWNKIFLLRIDKCGSTLFFCVAERQVYFKVVRNRLFFCYQ